MGSNELFIEGYRLPKPLSKTEICELIERYKQGDESAKTKLVEHNIRLVIFQVRQKFSTVNYDKNELVSIGNIGLLKAINTFDVSKNIEFATYATRCIDNEILMFLRKLKKHRNVDSLDKTICRDKEGNEFKIEDIISDDVDIADNYAKTETYAAIRIAIKELDEREKELILLHFGFYDGKTYTQKEIADKLSISQSYVSRLINRIVKKIGIQLEKIGIVELNNEQARKKENKAVQKNETNTQIEGENEMGRKLQTLYEYFNTYSKEQIDEMLIKLKDEEKELIKKRYGEDLQNPISVVLTDEEKKQYYGSLVPKMKRLLKNLNQERKRRKKKQIQPEQNEIVKNNDEKANDIKSTNSIIEKPVHDFSKSLEEQEVKEQQITKDDYIKLLELLRSPSFAKMLSVYSAKEVMIASLKLGYVDGKCFTTTAIANFLGIEEQEIIDITKKLLLAYKEKINQIFDGTIHMVIEEEKKKIKKKNNDINI